MLTEFKDIVLIQKLIVFLYASNYQEIDENIPFEKSFQASKIHYIQGEFYFKPSFFFFFFLKEWHLEYCRIFMKVRHLQSWHPQLSRS